MSDTNVPKSFMDKFTGFFFHTGKNLIMAIAYIFLFLGLIVTAVVAGNGKFDFSKPQIRSWAIAFICFLIIFVLSIVFGAVKSLRKFNNYFFTIVGFIAALAIAVVSGLIFFKEQGGDFTAPAWDIPETSYTIPAAASGSLFIIAVILLGFVVVGGIAYAISMADNWKKQKALKNA